jgi:hypothetical protein
VGAGDVLFAVRVSAVDVTITVVVKTVAAVLAPVERVVVVVVGHDHVVVVQHGSLGDSAVATGSEEREESDQPHQTAGTDIE